MKEYFHYIMCYPTSSFTTKSFLLIILIVTTFAANTFAKGNLFIIGGGKRTPELIQKMADLAGGSAGRLVIIPMASGSPQNTAEYQKNQFLEYGVSQVEYILFTQQTADTDSNLTLVKNATGIFFSGGDQRRLTAALLGTQLLDQIRQVYKAGGLIAGTSAGAAVMSEIMITGDELINTDSTRKFIDIRQSNIKTSKGFGFIQDAIIDQHFIKRKRHNRLISLVLEHAPILGIGIDESTAIWVKQDSTFEVMGESQVLIYDTTNGKNITASANGLLSASDIKMHVLIAGKHFDLKNQRLIP